MHKYAGKDGGEYGYFEKIAADTRYDQMERLIESQKRNTNFNNRTPYVPTDLSYLSVFGFLLYLIVLVYPYILSALLFSTYCNFFPVGIKIILFVIIWISYFPMLLNSAKIIK